MTDSQSVDYLENICKMFVNGSKNCAGQALEYQQMYISAIRHAIAKLQRGADMRGERMTSKEAIKLIQGIEEDGWNVTSDDVKALDLAIKALEFIDENCPKTFIDYLNGEQI